MILTLIFSAINDAIRPVSVGWKTRIVAVVNTAASAVVDKATAAAVSSAADFYWPDSAPWHQGEMHALHKERSRGLESLDELPAFQSWQEVCNLDMDGSMRMYHRPPSLSLLISTSLFNLQFDISSGMLSGNVLVPPFLFIVTVVITCSNLLHFFVFFLFMHSALHCHAFNRHGGRGGNRTTTLFAWWTGNIRAGWVGGDVCSGPAAL